MSFLHGNGAMFDSFRYDEYLSRAKPDNFIAKLNVDLTHQHEKKIVRVIVFVPHEFPLYLDHHQVVTVELADHPGLF
jgi:hypothetical protein